MVVGRPEAKSCCWPYRPPAKSEADSTVTHNGPGATVGPDCVAGSGSTWSSVRESRTCVHNDCREFWS
ncbi:unnamed protein product [Macrosiphum euphorbiae]|uniref:Uncharacterized protein n=1 Tax=Macrosiphum euphorbiae TaxID=13131 RepID=A0AAV0X3D1_9HEMI|nr:unnamed protein product [Macrosiphum euphorbiae]